MEDVLAAYNYDEFTPEKVERWLNFDAGPPLGEVAPDFPLWDLERNGPKAGREFRETMRRWRED